MARGAYWVGLAGASWRCWSLHGLGLGLRSKTWEEDTDVGHEAYVYYWNVMGFCRGDEMTDRVEENARSKITRESAGNYGTYSSGLFSLTALSIFTSRACKKRYGKHQL